MRRFAAAATAAEQPVAHRHDVADHDDRRRAEALARARRRRRVASVETSTRSIGVVAAMMTAAGVAGASPPAHQRVGDRSEILQSHVERRSAGRCGRAPPSRDRRRAGRMAGGEDDRLVDAAQRRRDAGVGERARSPAVTPGRMRNGTAPRPSASASSPPRPKTNGSPPLSRSTRWPARASSISAPVMSAWRADGLPPRLPANSSARLRGRERQDARDRPARRGR